MTLSRTRGRTYYAVHSARKYATGSATLYNCSVPGCTNRAERYAFRPLPDVPVRIDPDRGLAYQDDLDSLRPECNRCHIRTDTARRRGRCLAAEADAFVLDLIDRHGQLLLSRRVYVAAQAAGLNRFALRGARDRLGITVRRFHGADGGTGCVSVWLVPEDVVPDPGRSKRAETG